MAEKGADLNFVISSVLKYGVILSGSLVVIGVLLMVAKPPAGIPTNVKDVVDTNYGKPTLDLVTLFREIADGNPLSIIELGLLVLLAIPFARVAASTILFAIQRDRLYVAITLFVLIALLVSVFVVGPFVASSI